ncbi:hypothetical protein B0T25DRAFT_114830 [Lasiosphaeria hispida]|uniref:Enoyl reductase (ER) domain-containing protein n=1 Tax=Lasiosphaeria hispida TaxID=260671 RepID=A0AAJ0MI52_9PEZI|nr:hypothetical protein B0T25DRAFT_114830 [Lasiosphaeria hispida]
MSAWPKGVEPLESLQELHYDHNSTLLKAVPSQWPDPSTLYPLRAHVVQVYAIALTDKPDEWEAVANNVPPIPGFDFAGTVISTPKGSPFKPGSQVYGHTSRERPGNARPFTLALLQEMSLRPRLLKWEDCAAIPYPFLTAYQGLFTTGSLREGRRDSDFYPRRSQHSENGGKRVLITDAAAPVGFWALQLARLRGCGWITALVRREKDKARVCLLGAHEALNVNYSEGNLLEWRRNKFDVILDCEGFDTLRRCWNVIAKDGYISSTVEHPQYFKPDGASGLIKAAWVQARSCPYQLARAAHLLDCGILKYQQHNADRTFEWEEYEEAVLTVYSLPVTGSVILRVRKENPKELVEFFSVRDNMGMADESTGQVITAHSGDPSVKVHKEEVVEASRIGGVMGPKDEVDAFKEALNTFRDAQRSYIQAGKVLREATEALKGKAKKSPKPMSPSPSPEAASSSLDLGALPNAEESDIDTSLNASLEAMVSGLPGPLKQGIGSDDLESSSQTVNSEAMRFLSPELEAHLDAMIGASGDPSAAHSDMDEGG